MKGTLASALDYENDAVVRRFTHTYAVTEEVAADLFEQVKKWLWLCHDVEDDSSWRDPTWVPLLDEMWHTFILFTRAYADYCETRLGGFIHHLPGEGMDDDGVTDEATAAANAEAQLRHLIGIVHDHLGEATARKWFEELPARFPESVVQELFIRPA